MDTNSNKKIMMKKVLVLVAILLIAVGLFKFLKTQGYLSFMGFNSKAESWQAVFLNNSQVYFGHLQRKSDDMYKLTDIFYLRINQTLQPSNSQPNVNLVKLGSELHGPEDEMYIPKSQISFWENMRDDSQVVGAIKAYLEGQ